MSLDDGKKERQMGGSVSGGIASGEVFEHGTTKRGLKPRHSQMIALGGCVGRSSSYECYNKFD